MIDTVHTVETPEGVRLELRVAGPVPRALAFLLDAFIRSVLYLGLVVGVVSVVPNVADALVILLIFLGEWLYPVFFEVWNQGQTIGTVLRTRDGVKPVFVSPGHRVSLESVPDLVLACCDGYRIPKPTRLADQLVGEIKREASRRSR